MSLSSIPHSLRELVVTRDGGKCRYCRLSQYGQGAVFHVNHIVPRSKGGLTKADNLVLQCPYCSLHKSDKVLAHDPESKQDVPLYHPLRQAWAEHFVHGEDGACRGLSPTGRATVIALRMNDPIPRTARALQLRYGLL